MATTNYPLQLESKKQSCNENLPVLVKQKLDGSMKQKTVVQKYSNSNCADNQSKATTVPNNSPVKVDSDINRLMLDLCSSFEKIDCESDNTSCNICSFKSKHKKSLKMHYVLVHGKHFQLSKGERTTQQELCRFCEVKRQKIMSNIHYAAKYKNLDQRCSICQYKTSDSIVIKAKKLADGTLKMKSSARYRCQFCYYQALDSFSMETHYKRKHNQESVAMQCTNYGIPVQKDNQKMTEKCDKNIRKYKCNTCSYKTETKKLFRKHIRKHAEEKCLLNRTAEELNELLGTFGEKMDIK